jgi:hypothetical protein
MRNGAKSDEKGEGERMYKKRVKTVDWHHSSFIVSRVNK